MIGMRVISNAIDIRLLELDKRDTVTGLYYSAELGQQMIDSFKESGKPLLLFATATEGSFSKHILNSMGRCLDIRVRDGKEIVANVDIFDTHRGRHMQSVINDGQGMLLNLSSKVTAQNGIVSKAEINRVTVSPYLTKSPIGLSMSSWYADFPEVEVLTFQPETTEEERKAIFETLANTHSRKVYLKASKSMSRVSLDEYGQGMKVDSFMLYGNAIRANISFIDNLSGRALHNLWIQECENGKDIKFEMTDTGDANNRFKDVEVSFVQKDN